MFQLHTLLQEAMDGGASDVHLAAGESPVFRLHGELVRTTGAPLTPAELDSVFAAVLPQEKQEQFTRHGEVDAAYTIAPLGRFRVNVFRQRGSLAVALRTIPGRVKTLHELALPDVLSQLCDRPHGLVVVTGPTGSGKSTTLAAMIDLINQRHAKHVITLEDPIEFVHANKRSLVHQREIGADTETFAQGLRSALRQDPDVILLGEMRDLATIEIALQAAETGHLVLTTLHTNDAPTTVDRIVSVFPPVQQQQARLQLAGALQGIVAQRLFRRPDRQGRTAALEILIVTPAVRNLIRDAKAHQLMSAIQTGGKLGMRSMESAVRELSDRGLIAPSEYELFRQETASPSPIENGRF